MREYDPSNEVQDLQLNITQPQLASISQGALERGTAGRMGMFRCLFRHGISRAWNSSLLRPAGNTHTTGLPFDKSALSLDWPLEVEAGPKAA